MACAGRRELIGKKLFEIDKNRGRSHARLAPSKVDA